MDVMDLKVLHSAAVLASPPVPSEHFAAQLAIQISLESHPGPLMPQRVHHAPVSRPFDGPSCRTANE